MSEEHQFDKPFRFFLGGADLEMCTIRDLLKDRSIDYYPKDDILPDWEEATLEYYRDDLKEWAPQFQYVFVELRREGATDLLKSRTEGQEGDYFFIDHHNEQDNRPSSLEQVLQLIAPEEPLTTRQRAIAINDAKYIPGLLAEGFPLPYIKGIRREDLEAQGQFSHQFEIKKSASRPVIEIKFPQVRVVNFWQYDSVTIVEATPGGFGQIMDTLYFSRHTTPHNLIYCAGEVQYSGPQKQLFVDQFEKPDPDASTWSGGGSQGYFCYKTDRRDVDFNFVIDHFYSRLMPAYHIKRDLSKYQPAEQPPNAYSYHIFSFPFKIVNFPSEPDRVAVPEKPYWKHLLDQVQGHWEPVSAPTSTNPELITYNQLQYFHDFTWDLLLGTDQEEGFVHFFRYRESDLEGQTYKIDIKKAVGDRKTFELQIDAVELQLLKTGVGILSFFLLNTDANQSAPEKILAINQYGRRLYPPFYTPASEASVRNRTNTFKEGLQGLKDGDGKQLIKGTQDLELAVQLSFLGVELRFPQEAEKIDPRAAIPEKLVQLIWKLGEPAIAVEPVIDDRMYVLSWYGNDFLAQHLGRQSTREATDWWFQYVYVDNPEGTSCPDASMATGLIREATNARWAPYGTLYGISRYSFVVLTGQWESLRRNHATFVLTHLQTLYYRMVSLCLMQHASLLVFSDQIKRHTDSNVEIPEVQKSYSRFINRMYFRSVTAQDQGIELYDRLQQVLRIEEEVVALERELASHRNLLELEAAERQAQRDREQAERDRRLNRIFALLSAVLVIPGMVVGYYGMNTFNDVLAPYDYWHLIGIIVSTIVATIACYYFLRSYYFNESSERRSRQFRFSGIILMAFLVALLALPFLNKRSLKQNQDVQTLPADDTTSIMAPTVAPADTATETVLDTSNLENE